MWTMGDDFQYQFAESWFRQMDRLIHYVNKVFIFLAQSHYLGHWILTCSIQQSLQDGRVNALYSTPSLYVDAKNDANLTWPLKTHDFFP